MSAFALYQTISADAAKPPLQVKYKVDIGSVPGALRCDRRVCHICRRNIFFLIASVILHHVTCSSFLQTGLTLFSRMLTVYMMF